MLRFIQSLWSWSWLVTLPLSLFGAIWLLPAWRDARQFLVWHPASMHRSSDVDLDLRRILLARLDALHTDLASSWKSRWRAQPSPLAQIDVQIAPANLARLNANLPLSGKEGFVRALLRYPDGDYEKVGVRYRGDSLHHWGFVAKSWLIRTSKDRLIDGQRRWHLVLPRWRSVGSYHVNLAMARRMGVLTVDSRPVDLRINGRQHGGIHLLQPQQDESFLRNQGRLPSDLYVGDMTPLDDNYVNEVQKGGLWQLPWLWQKAAVNNKFPETSRLPLEVLFFRLYHGTDAELLELLDLPAWARFSAYMQLFAASHMDMGHNWKLLYDAGKLMFEPVVGDGNGLPDNVLALTQGLPGRDLSITTPLLARLHRNHDFLRLKNEALAGFFRNNLHDAYFRELLEFERSIAPTLATYPQLDWMGTADGGPLRYFNDKDLQARRERVTPDLAAWFVAHRENQSPKPDEVKAAIIGRHALRLNVEGRASIQIGLRLSPGDTLDSARLRVLRESGRVEEAPIGDRFTLHDGIAWLDWPLLAQREIANPIVGHSHVDHLVKPATYDLDLGPVDVTSVAVVVRGPYGDRFDVARFDTLPAIPWREDNTGILPAVRTITRWTGIVELHGVTELHGPLEIAAGTTVRLGPDASLIVRGRVTAQGTATQPVRFERLESGAAWGTFAIVGPGADGSILEHCEFSGGSGLVSPYTLFSGMVSIRHVRDMKIRHCRFSANSIYDDLFHAVYSTLDISESEFLRANRDGIDLDLCQGRLHRITVTGTGNDALDLMTSEVVVSGSRLTGAGDKGLSAGEACRVLVLDSVLENNNVGLQAKDGTQALLYNVTLANNTTHLSGYHKNRAYPDMVHITLAKSALSGGREPVDLRDGSTLEILDSTLPAPLRHPGLTVDAQSSPSATAASQTGTPAFGRLLPGTHWILAKPGHRGSNSLAPASPPSSP